MGEATAEFHTLAFPGGLEKGLLALKNNDAKSILNALEFLIADPYFFRSGYSKETVIRLLKKVELSKSEIKQLQELVIQSLAHGTNRIFVEYRRLAAKLADEQFEAKINEILKNSKEQRVIERASAMLAVLKQRK